MSKPFFLTVLLLFITDGLYAQNDRPKGVVSIAAGLTNNQSWELEPSVAYYFSKYIGGSLGLKLTRQYNQSGFSGTIPENSRTYWEIEDDEANVSKFMLHPAISFRSPVWWLDKDHEMGLTIQIEPGMNIAFPPNDQVTVNYREKEYNNSTVVGSERVSNTKGDWLFWDIRGSISLNIDRFVFSAGYSVSNFDIYSGRRNIVVENLKLDSGLPAKEKTHAFFISFGYWFASKKQR